MTPIGVVLFDLGNVIAHIDFDSFWRSLNLSDLEKRTPFKDKYKEFTKAYETGLLLTSEYLQKLYSLFNQQYTLSELKWAVESIIEDPVEGMDKLVQEVSANCKTALVSNTNELHYSLSKSKIASLQHLGKHYCSYILQVMKPAYGFYDAIVKDLKCDPSTMLFVDDLQENIDGAVAAGMCGVRFESVQQLKIVLKSYNIVS